MEGDWIPLDVASVRGILPRGGTILGSSRTNPHKADDGERRILDTVSRLGVDGLVVIGGEDTLGVATKLAATGLPIVGVPKTIDNDLGATDYTFGFNTAVTIATEAIDRLHTTAESHHRVLIVEVMGRHAGWIAWHSGVAGGANAILIPERPFLIDEVCAFIEHRFASHYAPIVVVAEGALPVEGTLPPRTAKWTRSAICGSRVSEIYWSPRSPSARGKKHAPPFSDTYNVVVAQRRLIGCSPRDSDSMQSTHFMTVTLVRWLPCMGLRSISYRSPKRRRRSSWCHRSSMRKQRSSSDDRIR